MTFPGVVKSAGAAALLTVTALSLAGCGRRSDLEVPGVPAAKAASNTGSIVPGASAQSKSRTKPVAPKRAFVLDPLL